MITSMPVYSGASPRGPEPQAYSNDFLLMTLVSLSAFPLLALIRSPKAAPVPCPEAAAHAVMD